MSNKSTHYSLKNQTIYDKNVTFTIDRVIPALNGNYSYHF